MDTLNFPKNHPCYSIECKKEPGRFSDVTGSKPIWEHVALRSNSYGYSLVGEEHIKAKGITNQTVKKHMTLENHKICLFKNLEGNVTLDDYTPYREMRSFKSYNTMFIQFQL